MADPEKATGSVPRPEGARADSVERRDAPQSKPRDGRLPEQSPAAAWRSVQADLTSTLRSAVQHRSWTTSSS